MNKTKVTKAVSVIMTIVIVILSIVLFFYFIFMIDSFKYAKEQREKKASENENPVMEYELEHRAYDEIVDTWYVKRMSSLEPVSGYENTYNIAEYCHLAFMSKVYEAEGNADRIRLCDDRRKAVKDKLGSYSYISDEVDGVLEKLSD